MTKTKDAALWDETLWAGLNHDPELDTLVPVSSDFKPSKVQKKQMDTVAEMMTTDIVEEVMIKILGNNKLKKWSARDLSIAIAADDRVNIKDETVRKTHLAKIRSENKRRGWRCFDSMASPQVWRYMD